MTAALPRQINKVKNPHSMSNSWFTEARYGLFIHYGLYSLLERGEWVWNREQIPASDYGALADRFTAENFNADAICDLAVRAGMRYVVLTTMHHEGFRLYDTALSDFSTVKTVAKRDLVAEIIAAARKRGLKVGLYHSLNNWYDQPTPWPHWKTKPPTKSSSKQPLSASANW